MKKLFLLSMVAVAAVMVSCSKDDDGSRAGNSGKNPNAKLVRKIQVYNSEDTEYNWVLTFDYDSQNRVVKMTDDDYVTTFAYSKNMVTVNNNHYTRKCTLNSNGYITKIEYDNDEDDYNITYTYNNGYLYQVNDSGDVYTHLWQNNNLSSIKAPWSNYIFEYGKQTTSAISIDIMYLISYYNDCFVDFECGLLGFLGNKSKNLPTKLIDESYTNSHFEYEFNTDGSISRILITYDDSSDFVEYYDFVY